MWINSQNGKHWLMSKCRERTKMCFKWVLGWLCNWLPNSSPGRLLTVHPVSAFLRWRDGPSPTPLFLHVYVWRYRIFVKRNSLGDMKKEEDCRACGCRDPGALAVSIAFPRHFLQSAFPSTCHLFRLCDVPVYFSTLLFRGHIAKSHKFCKESNHVCLSVCPPPSPGHGPK